MNTACADRLCSASPVPMCRDKLPLGLLSRTVTFCLLRNGLFMQKIDGQFSNGVQFLAFDVVNLMCVNSRCRSYVAIASHTWNNVPFFCCEEIRGLVLHWGRVLRINTLLSVIE